MANYDWSTMNVQTAVTLAILTPFVFAGLVLLVSGIFKRKIGWFATLGAITTFLLVMQAAPSIIDGDVIQASYSWIPSAGLSFSIYADGLALLIGLLVSGIGIFVFIYSNGYMVHEKDLTRYYCYLLLFMGAMLGVAFSSNLIMLFIFWELTSVSSYLLIGYWRHKAESEYGALKSLLITGFGGLIMLAGFLLISDITGTFELSEILNDSTNIQLVRDSSMFLWVIFMIFIGAAAKSGQGPFYIWLPNAMEAPTPVSAYLHSATMVKAGIYLIARIHPIFSGTDAWLILVSGTGMLTMGVVGFLAFKQTDIKAILAYSTVSQLGYIVAMYGYSTITHPDIGVVAATYHIVNHASFKAGLFLVAGIVAHQASTRDIRKLGGLFKSMPFTGTFAIITGLAMAGIPPLNGFISKEMFYESALETGHALGGIYTYLFPLMALLAGIATFAYSIRFIHGIFFGKNTLGPVREAPPLLLIPAGFFAALCILIGLFPNIAAHYIVEPVVQGILLHNVELYMTIATIVLGSIIYTRYDAIGNWEVNVAKKIPSFSVNYWYDKLVFGARDKTAQWSAKSQTGNIVTYMIALLLLMVALSLGPIILLNVDSFLPKNLNFGNATYTDLTLLFMIVSAVAAAMLKRYIPAILALSGLGYLVVLIFIILNAPDLALTQILVETLTTIVFFLVIAKVNQDFFEKTPTTHKIRDLVISGIVTVSIALLLINATGNGILAPFETLSYYFFENTLPLGGGHNIVNVIIVDFRGYDTLGEITVLCLAGLGVLNLIKSRTKEDVKK